MKRTIVLLVGTLIALVGLALVSQPGSAAPSAPSAPAGDPVIIEVTGDAANGFGIEYSDGTGRYPPTDSESMAECKEYDRRSDRVKCRAEVRTWYRDLADMKLALEYAHEHP